MAVSCKLWVTLIHDCCYYFRSKALKAKRRKEMKTATIWKYVPCFTLYIFFVFASISAFVCTRCCYYECFFVSCSSLPHSIIIHSVFFGLPRYFFMLNVWFMMHVRVWHMICNALPNFSVSNTPPLPIIKFIKCANANGFVVSMHFAKRNTYKRKPKHILPFIFVDLVFTICDL